jgi:hypothetical protein
MTMFPSISEIALSGHSLSKAAVDAGIGIKFMRMSYPSLNFI